MRKVATKRSAPRRAYSCQVGGGRKGGGGDRGVGSARSGVSDVVPASGAIWDGVPGRRIHTAGRWLRLRLAVRTATASVEDSGAPAAISERIRSSIAYYRYAREGHRAGRRPTKILPLKPCPITRP